MSWENVQRKVSLKPYTTLKAGGNAELFSICRTVDELAGVAVEAQKGDLTLTPLGWGSNVLPSDAGVPGLCVVNLSSAFELLPGGKVIVDSGFGFQDLFLRTVQSGLAGLEFAVGIPGTVGGAMVSNAGAYRSNIADFVTRVEVVFEGQRQWVEPSWMQFSYRDSVLRRDSGVAAVILRIELQLAAGDRKTSFDTAREYQRQRIGKQPPSASAGSFFKNVTDPALAQSVEGLSAGMRANNVVPAGFLIEACGLKGHRIGGAMVGTRHANFILNVMGATATDRKSVV